AAAIMTAGGQTAHAETESKTDKRKVVVEVESGDNLSKIAKTHDTTYVRIFFANKNIKHPDIIYPGDKLRIPDEDEDLAERKLPSDAQVPKETTSSVARSSVRQSKRLSTHKTRL